MKFITHLQEKSQLIVINAFNIFKKFTRCPQFIPICLLGLVNRVNSILLDGVSQTIFQITQPL